ncbi:PadR family transcriptional regulator [Sphingomonas sp.]|uniref:PadR family transcriptional regulator n=1 Tax=Sphingomonas sp. TaxID=28214 RepID=UPI0035C87CCE
MFHHHMHGRSCGPRGGGWSRGPFHFSWDGDGSRSRRMFDSGELRFVLLRLIADQPRHGYDLIRAIEEMTGGRYAPSPGVVYPTLSLLAEMGHVAEQQSDDTRKRFAITDGGRAHLEENRDMVDALMARLTDLGAEAKRTDGAPIRRAMTNLGVAVRERLARGDFSEDTLHDVAALIDEVAQKIERLR